MLLPELTEIHEQFLALSRISRDRFDSSLGGKLVLRAHLDAPGIAAVIAASIAGAASLCLDADAERLRQGLRAGFVDFVVAHLDEALRILKNEIRRGRPISVGLTTQPEPAIDAMIERGLQPDLLSAIPPSPANIFIERGAVSLPQQTSPEPETALLTWSVADNRAPAMRAIAELAAAALDPNRSDTAARRRWLEQSPRYLGRSFAKRQCLRMSEREIDSYRSRVQTAVPDVNIARDGQPL